MIKIKSFVLAPFGAAIICLGAFGCGGSGSNGAGTTGTTGTTKSSYKLVDFGTQPGKANLTNRGGPSAMNFQMVVGQLESAANTSHPVVWTIASASSVSPVALQTKNTPSGVQFSADDINDSGVIVGDAYPVAGGSLTAVKWPTSGDAPVSLGFLGADKFSEATAINSGGVIVGDSGITTFTPMYWLANQTTPSAMAMLAGYSHYFPSAINSTGQVVGGAYSGDYSLGAAVYWSSVQANPVALAIPAGATQAYGNHINDSGKIVGIYTDKNGNQQAALWLASSPSSLPKVLPIPNGFTGASANRINAAGVIAGSVFTATSHHAVIWDASGKVTDLNTLIPAGSGMLLSEATAINAAGEIVGNMTATSGGAIHSFLLIPQ